jgi:hypothetical protein
LPQAASEFKWQPGSSLDPTSIFRWLLIWQREIAAKLSGERETWHYWKVGCSVRAYAKQECVQGNRMAIGRALKVSKFQPNVPPLCTASTLRHFHIRFPRNLQGYVPQGVRELTVAVDDFCRAGHEGNFMGFSNQCLAGNTCGFATSRAWAKPKEGSMIDGKSISRATGKPSGVCIRQHWAELNIRRLMPERG